ncbi:MAG: type II toxin-antitoxin system PemK/MazF family toxin [Rhodospirillaceae bacterium]|nr:type II toxin-antitoxin system PemK/MazF family toxin [Rhodospirillaceae bacterium]
MAVVKPLRRFDVVLVALDPTVGAEIRKTRPCVVISPDEMNLHLDTVIVAPMTTTFRRYPSRVAVKFGGKTGEVALDQLRSIDTSRAIKNVGTISPASAKLISAVLVEMFS